MLLSTKYTPRPNPSLYASSIVLWLSVSSQLLNNSAHRRIQTLNFVIDFSRSSRFTLPSHAIFDTFQDEVTGALPHLSTLGMVPF